MYQVLRCGEPRALLEGHFRDGSDLLKAFSTSIHGSTVHGSSLHGPSVHGPSVHGSTHGRSSHEEKSSRIVQRPPKHLNPNFVDESCLLLPCGVEIRCYSLVDAVELTREEIEERSVEILSAPVPYNPKVDLVAADLAVIPATLARIDSGKCRPIDIPVISLCSPVHLILVYSLVGTHFD